MPFSEALYYPGTYIKNEDWLKTVLLFWDKIYTIVPESIGSLYWSNTNQYLQSEGILKSIPINSDSTILKTINYEVLNYLNSSEGYQLLTDVSNEKKTQAIKLPRSIQRLVRMHSDKFSNQIKFFLQERLIKDAWYDVDDKFASFYMTLLANKICDDKSLALLTDNNLNSNFLDKIKLDNHNVIQGRNEDDINVVSSMNSLNLAIGLFTNLILQGIKITSLTSFDDIITFKNKHTDELGLFMQNVSDLVNVSTIDMNEDAFSRQLNIIYKRQFLPSYNNLKKALTSSKIKWIPDTCFRVGFLSIPATAIPSYIGVNSPVALVAAAGISLISSYVSYNEGRKEILRQNPYSYLLSINKAL